MSLHSLKPARFLFLLQAGTSTVSSSLASQSMKGHIGPGLEESSLSLAIEDSCSQPTTSDSSLSDIGGWFKPTYVYDAKTESIEFNKWTKKNHAEFYHTYLKTNEKVTAVGI